MILLRPFFLLLGVLSAESAPVHFASGVVLGMWMGFSPIFSLQTILGVLALFLVRVNVFIAVLAALLFTPVCWLASPVADAIGAFILLKIPALHPMLAWLSHSPIMPYTLFNHSEVLGNMILSLLLTVPLYRGSFLVFGKYRPYLSYRIKESRLFRSLRLTRLYDEYSRVNHGNESKYPNGIFRPKGAIPLIAFLLMATVYVSFFFDSHLNTALMSTATNLNHAQVFIKRTVTHFRSCSIELRGVEITSPTDPNYNVAEIDAMHVNLRCGLLLRKKMYVEGMTVKGVRLNTPRKFPGLPTATSIAPFPGLMERVASGFYGQVRAQMGESPLRNVGKLLTGIDVSARVEENYKKLASQQKLRSISEKLEHYQTAWAKEAQGLPSSKVLFETHGRMEAIIKTRKPAAIGDASLGEMRQIREELAGNLKSVKGFYDRIYRDMGGIAAEISQVEGTIGEDIRTLRSQLNLPRLDKGDLTQALFGPQLLTQLERLAYWIDLSRRKMPKRMVSPGQIAITTRDGAYGTVVSYQKPGSYPDFLLENGRVESAGEEGRGTVSGEFTGLTSEPATFGWPFTFKLTGNFPAANILGVQLEGSVDHTKEVPLEKYRLAVEKLPISKVALNDGGDALVQLDKANVSFTSAATFQEGEIRATLEAEFKDAQFGVQSRFGGIQQTLLDILGTQDRFGLYAQMEGSFEKPRFEATSSMGKALAEGMQKQFRHQMAAIDDDLRKNLLDRVHPMRLEASRQMFEIKEKIITPLEHQIKALQEMTRYAEEGVERMEGKKGPTKRTATRRTS